MKLRPPAAPLQTRDPDTLDDLATRSIQLRADTVDEKARTVEAVFATETPVRVFDVETWKEVDEVLRLDGMTAPDSVPMLANHSRWSLDDVLGSGREIRAEADASPPAAVGRLHFADGDEAAERAWHKVRGRHLRAVSVGYQVTECHRIPKGESATVAGHEYTASPRRDLKIATAWTLREISLVPIGADPLATTRKHPATSERKPMPVELRRYLESLGLRADAADAQAWAFYSALSGERRATADQHRGDAQPPADPQANPPAPPADLQRADPPPAPPANPPAPPAPPVDPQRADPPPANPPAPPADATRAERTRQARLREMAGADVPLETLTRALDEGWTEAQAAPQFLAAVRAARPAAVADPPARGPAIHSRSHEGDCTRDALAAGMMIRHGLDPTTARRRVVGGCYQPGSALAEDEAHRAAEFGHHYSDWSLVDYCREACRLDGRPAPANRFEAIRSAMSGGSLSYIFSTSINARLLGAYSDAPDTTEGWTAGVDVANFLTQERTSMGKIGQLTKHAKGGTADHVAPSDSQETYKIARYSGKFVVDEIDIINDRFGAMEQTTPEEMGNSAATLRPDLVFAIILANGALDSDSVALFHASSHSNYGTTGTALAAGTLQAGVAAIANQRQNSRPLNIRPRFLIVPQDLWATAEILLASAERHSSSGTANPLKNQGITPRYDSRLGASGCTDPATGTAYTGGAAYWLLAAKAGENGAKTIEVGYLRGTGRAPQIRAYTLTEGQWGLGWDVNMDIGAKALDYRSLYFATGEAAAG